jgi:hypothetical protein
MAWLVAILTAPYDKPEILNMTYVGDALKVFGLKMLRFSVDIKQISESAIFTEVRVRATFE